MMQGVSTALLVLLFQSSQVQPESWRRNLPEWSLKRIERVERQKQLAISNALNPYYLQADLNGDCKLDLAVLVRNAPDQKTGIVILLRAREDVIVLGAGSNFDHGGDDFSWMDVWSIYPKGVVSRGVGEGPPPRLLGDALLVMKSEAASAIIYWNGKSFSWYQQGD